MRQRRTVGKRVIRKRPDIRSHRIGGASAFEKIAPAVYSASMRKTILAALALSLLLLQAPLPGLVLPFEILKSKEGLPQSQVTALAQDREGYLWVGTWGGGLGRFNGTEFKIYSLEDGLPNTRINEILAAQDGSLWISTSAGVSRWNDHRLKTIDAPAVHRVRCRALAEDSHQRIWIGTDNGVVLWTQGEFKHLHPGAAAGPLVHDILADREGILVAADNGLWRYAGEGEATRIAGPPGIDETDFRTLAATAEGLWLGTYSQGAWLRDDAGWHKSSGHVAPRSVYRMSVEPSGILYIATIDNGLFFKRPGEPNLEHWGIENGLPSRVVNSVLEDREKNLWVGTDIGGLALLSHLAVINHTEKQGLPSACVFGINQGETPDSLWLGTLHGAVHYQVRPQPQVLEIVGKDNGLDNEWVWRVLRTDDGCLWFLTDTALFFRRKGEKAVQPIPPDVPLRHGIPYEIVIDGQGNLWECGEWKGGGLACRDRSGTWRYWEKDAAGRPLAAVHRLARRRRGGVWIVVKDENGYRVEACDGNRLIPVAGDGPFAAETRISALYEDSRGRLWAGCDDGLAVMEADGAWRRFERSHYPSFENRNVYSIGEDWKGTIWINTARGGYRVLDNSTIEAFTPDDGLADWETNANGFFSDARGDIWIGTVSGLSQYNPSGRVPNSEPPRLVVESVQLPGRMLEFPRRLDLSWGERTLALNVAVLSFRSRNRVAYRYRMAGMENDWQPLRRLAELRYTNLPAGDLKLLLQPVNESGIWGDVVALPIRVRPPFWMTLWFRAAALLSLLAAGVGAWRWRTLLLRRRNVELEKEVGKRTAELEYLATYDPLTALHNRRAILAFFDGLLAPGRGSNRQLGCIMIDLNRFKQVNDTLGHAAGDQVLKEMAARIQDCLRQGDVLGRLGGDEFLIVLPGADEEALRAVERRVGALECRAGEGDAVVVVTAACGGVAIPAGNTAPAATILAQADDLLYRAKKASR